MAIRKSDLYRSLWASCDELRGGMDASQYKDYVLTLLFVKYVSDQAKAPGADSLIEVPEGGSFDDIAGLKGKKEIGEGINKAIARLAEENDLQGVIDVADFDDDDKLGRGKEMQDRLSRLVAIFEGLNFSASQAQGDDLLGDAYEYLMRHFATESGKSKGQFYTPAEVSRVVAKVVGIGPDTRQDQTVYDPTCGSGSLLLKAADEAPRGMSIYGQEMDNATWALARMNMFLHGHETHEIWRGNTLSDPHFTAGGKLKAFDFAVANPPFSTKSWTNGVTPDNDPHQRFEFGVPPAKNGDYAFLLHVLKSLNSTGKGAIILPHGVLFRGNQEAVIRRNLVKRGYINGVIGLPANLFYGTGIPACIVVLDKENAQARTGVFMVDASKGFTKDGAKNRLRSQDIHKIVDVFNNQIEVGRYSRMVPLSEISDPKNDYNLNIPRYIDSSEPEDIQDLHAHVHGGIPDRDLDALSRYWDAFPQLRDELFQPLRPGYSELAIDVGGVQQAVLDAPEFQKFATEVDGVVAEWFDAHSTELEGIGPDTQPADVIASLSEDLLGRFRSLPLLDEYGVYEQLMTYWHSVMHDDVSLLLYEGWSDAATPRRAIEDKERKLSELPDLVVGSGRGAVKYKTDLIPPALVVARCLADEQGQVDELSLRYEDAARAVEQYVEEHAVEDGLLAGAMDDGKTSKALAAARLREANMEEEPEAAEIAALKHLIELYAAEATAKKAVKEAQAALDAATLKGYGELTADDVKAIVLGEKWRAEVGRLVSQEVHSLTAGLVTRLGALGARYVKTMDDLAAELMEFDARTVSHLARMGIT